MVLVACNRPSADTATPQAPGADAAKAAAAPASSEPSTPAPAPPSPANWSYEGEGGPDQWGSLQPEYAKCASGQAQSPIDLPDAKSGGKTPGPITVEYKPVPLAVQFDGRTIGFENSSESSLLVDGARYFLVRGELHAPAEHRVGGKPFDMELQLHHRSEADEWFVLSVLMNKGDENAPLKTVFDYLPVQATSTVDVVPGVQLDLSTIVPNDPAYRYYDGSHTKPPCSEGVRWAVLSKTGTVSENQLRRYAAVAGGATNRPIQQLNNRKVGVYGR